MADYSYRSSLSAIKYGPLSCDLPLVPREELLDAILSSPMTKLICLQAPAGCGKSTAMAQLASRFAKMGIATAWITLDKLDNNLGLFVSKLAHALAPIFDTTNSIDLAREVQSPNPGGLALNLLDRMAAHPSPFVLFIDDLDKVDNVSLRSVLAEILGQLPRGAQLVIGSSQDLSGDFTSHRDEGMVLEFTARDLAFGLGEIERLVAGLYAHSPRGTELRLLHRVSAGNPLIIQLYSLLVAEGFDSVVLIEHLAKPGTTVLSELLTEYMRQCQPQIRELIEYSSVLGFLDSDYLSYCTGLDSASCTSLLSSQSILLRADNGSRRLHESLVVLVCAELASDSPDRLSLIHRKASDYYFGNGLLVDAIDHGLESGDKETFFGLIEAHADALLCASHMHLVENWLREHSLRGELDSRPYLKVIYAWASLFSSGPKNTASLIDELVRESKQNPEIETHLVALRPTFAALSGKQIGTSNCDARVLGALPEQFRFPLSALAFSLTNILSSTGRLDEVQEVVGVIREQPGYSKAFESLFDGAVALVGMLRGNLSDSVSTLRGVVQPECLDVPKSANGVAIAGLLLGEAMYEMDHRDLADRLLGTYIPLVEGLVAASTLLRAYRVRARLSASRGRPEEALNHLTDLEFRGRQEEIPEFIASARLERLRLQLVLGDKKAAEHELEAMNSDPSLGQVSTDETLEVGRLRHQVYSGEHNSCIGALTKLIDDAENQKLMRQALTLRIILSVALWKSGNSKSMKSYLEPALNQALREGYVRAFLDEGEILVGMLSEYLRGPRVKREYRKLVQSLLGSLCDPIHEQRRDAKSHILTRKEIQVVTLLAEGLSNLDIATRMIVAETTVKTHLRNINLKLDVSNRTAAVAEARRIKLIP